MTQPNSRKAELIALSAEMRVLKALGQISSVNEGLMLHYKSRTGGTEFHGFYDWKERGYKVKKGEQGSALWSRPKKMKLHKVVAGEETEIELDKFAVAYVCHERQVEKV